MAHESASKTKFIRILSWFITCLLISVPALAQQTGRSTPITPANPLFLPPVAYDSGGKLAWTLAVADLNGDGKPDIAVVNYGLTGSGSVGVLFGNGDGTFRRGNTYAAGGGPTAIAIGDLNGDGKPDLVVANQGCPGLDSNCVGVLLGNGDGSFQPVAIFSDGIWGWAGGEGISTPIMIADVNGDDKPDLLVVSQTDRNYRDGFVGVLLGNGDGTFKPVKTYDSGGFAAFSGIVADVNGDGMPDVVVVNCTITGFTDCFTNEATVGVLLGNGDGSFQPVRKFSTGGAGSFFLPVVVADVNSDGKPDILVGHNCYGNTYNCSAALGSFGLLLGNGDGTFQPAVTYDVEGGAVSIAVADLNGDGNLDLVVAGSPVEVWLGNGDGTFRHLASYPTSGSTGRVLLADLNSDGNLDLVGINGASSTADVRLGDGDGTFQGLQIFSLGGSQFSWATLADVNGDARPDLLSANWCASECQNEEGTVGVLLNNTPICTTPPVVSLSAVPKSLWPPNGKMVPVTISGTITVAGAGCAVKTTTYAVKDEYGEVHPGGPVTLGVRGTYSFAVLLQASRLGTDLDGRLYTVTVTASNTANKTKSQSGTVIVPHDQGH
jgi:hypothetical protein